MVEIFFSYVESSRENLKIPPVDRSFLRQWKQSCGYFLKLTFQNYNVAKCIYCVICGCLRRGILKRNNVVILQYTIAKILLWFSSNTNLVDFQNLFAIRKVYLAAAYIAIEDCLKQIDGYFNEWLNPWTKLLVALSRQHQEIACSFDIRKQIFESICLTSIKSGTKLSRLTSLAFSDHLYHLFMSQ